MELALDDYDDNYNHHSRFVSILVFVELALDVHECSARLHTINKVSILVFVELALDGNAAILNELNTMLFQSLFSWNLLLM